MNNQVENKYCNLVVEGTSGVGKTLFLKELVCSVLSDGGAVRVIDVTRDYGRFSETLNGQVIGNSAFDLFLNPFTHVDKNCKSDVDQSLEYVLSIMSSMVDLNSGVSDFEKACLREAINSVWDRNKTESCIGDVILALEQSSDPSAQALAQALQAFGLNGVFRKYVNGRAVIDVKNPLVVFNVFDIGERMDPIVISLLMYNITQAMSLGKDSKPIMVIDESWWSLLNSDDGENMLNIICDRVRQYGGTIISTVQDPGDHNPFWQHSNCRVGLRITHSCSYAHSKDATVDDHMLSKVLKVFQPKAIKGDDDSLVIEDSRSLSERIKAMRRRDREDGWRKHFEPVVKRLRKFAFKSQETFRSSRRSRRGKDNG